MDFHLAKTFHINTILFVLVYHHFLVPGQLLILLQQVQKILVVKL